MNKRFMLVGIIIVVSCIISSCAPASGHASVEAGEIGKTFTNSIDMKFVRIDPGVFMMGKSTTPLPDELTKNLSYPRREDLAAKFPHGDPQKFAITIEHVRNGDFDEKPAHRVNISRPFYMGVFEVTTAQYEKFDPSHRALRGKNGFPKEDNEAVIFVSWHEASAFCGWLSEKEGLPYRLPTEAEWEYACRAGTTTHFWTGDSLPEAFHKNVERTSFNEPNDIVPLTVGWTPANPWGLFDMHGNVEEWCHDWYGPYKAGKQVDPVGMADGDFKVTRGGSHGTNLYYLRSANRMGTLPDNKHWLIGFRVVMGELPKTKPLTIPPPQRYQLNVKQETPPNLRKGPDPDKPYFKGPRRYVKIPQGSCGPLYYHHNHDPAIVECANGDLLTIWYTCVEERGRELAVAASRLRYGSEQWEPASPFWDTPDRNDHCPALWFDGKDTICHFNGLCVAGKWEPLAIIMRTSKDNGVTWSKARLIAPEHGFRQMVGEPVFRTREGAICVGADAEHGSTIWVSRDNGKTWYDPGGKINGIHAGIVQLSDARLMAVGRNQNIDGWMPKSISSDMGKTWKATASIFPPITGGQRAALIRLKEGPLFFASFAKDIKNFEPTPDGVRPPRHVASIFGAVSYDDGETWPVRRIISDGKPDHPVDTIDNAPVLMNPGNSEPLAYMSVCQTADGVIHLISSTNHYAFNLAWLKEGRPAGPASPTARMLPVRKSLEIIYNGSRLPTTSNPPWHFVAERATEKSVASVLNPGLLKISTQGQSNVCWSSERLDGFGKVDPHKGLTAELAVQVSHSSDKNRGFDFEVFVRGGTLTVNHYFISVTPAGVYYWYDNQLIEIAAGLDNSSAMHTYRLAVREDTAVQIYRDGELLGVQPTDLLIGWSEPARDSFVQWGAGAAKVEASVSYIACDLTGPTQPD
ncbi:MAG TPA: SUMF1/EgtB/PvdO family nonheme iron enzyme [Sedimentisphaerales bacterium]|nr:SUMF1/EgtB/PvdO family nonheme iron enzyme [Sedimentisphaerales bacterium]